MTIHNPISSMLPTLGSKLLGDTQARAEQLDTDNSEALHDFRVSVRRLRSFLESYEDFIKDAKKYRQRLSDIMTLTNPGRNTEVHMAWLQARQKKASEVEQEGIQYLLENLGSSDPVDIAKVKKQSARVVKKLEDMFSKDVEKKASFAEVTAKVLQRHHKHLEKHLAKIETSENNTALHDARIAGKKLRYTLELLESQETETLVKELKRFQDITGELHDLHVLESKVQTFLLAETVLWSQAFRDGSKTLSQEELSDLSALRYCYGLAALQRRLESEKASLFQELHHHWLGDTPKDFFQSINALVEELTKPAEIPSEEATPPAPKKTRKQKSKPPLLGAPETLTEASSSI